MKLFLLVILILAGQSIYAQQPDSLHAAKPSEKIIVTPYERVIFDTKGNVRYDENIVVNLKLNRWLGSEGGFRLGHRPQKFDSYYHYKIELNTKSFWNTARLVFRISNDINQSAPIYSRSYYIALAELRRPISKRFAGLAAWGHVWTAQRNNSLDGTPSLTGSRSDYLAYKIGIRYSTLHKGLFEWTCGNYDVFNPYQPSNSFLQMHFQQELTARTSLTSNFRYQFDTHIDKPSSYFLIAGVRIRI